MSRKCGYCGKDISNKHPNAKFCCLKHKDRFHNETNPRGIYAHLADIREKKEMSGNDYYFATTHPFDLEALGQD